MNSASSPTKTAENGSAARPYIGGQAVLEGVMMRAPKSFAIVVRRRDGSLQVRERAMHDERRGAAKLPFLRGVMSLVESLKLGSESLRFSVEQLEKDLALEEARGGGQGGSGAPPVGGGAGGENPPLNKTRASGITNVLTALGMTVFSLATQDDPTAEGTEPEREPAPAAPTAEKEAKRGGAGMWLMLVMAIAFFVALPQAAAAGINKVLHWNLEVQAPQFQALTGGFKLLLVVGYLLLIRRLPDIRRVFQYHGAEHKTISTYEAREELTVANARAKTTLHPRCGTTFLVMVALVSILVFTAVGSFLPRIHTGNAALDNVVFFLEKLPFLPAIAGLTFELQRLFARYCTTGPLRALLWPGFLVQKITTIEPDDDQLEIALASLRVTLFRQEAQGGGQGGSGAPPVGGGAGGENPPPNETDVKFANYESLLHAERLRPATMLPSRGSAAAA